MTSDFDLIFFRKNGDRMKKVKHLTKTIKKNITNDIAETKNNKILMRINKLFAKWHILIITVIIIDILFFLAMNYLLNICLSFLSLIRNPDSFSYSLTNAFKISKNCEIIYLLMFILLMYIDIKFIYGVRVYWKDYNVGQKGTEQWATLDELKEQYKAVPELKEEFEGRGGVLISRYEDKILIDDKAVNNLIIGCTRSGKGENFIFPMIDVYSRSEEKASLIVTDPKLELYKSSYKILKSRGYDVYLLNLQNPDYSMKYNPLSPAVQLYKDGNIDDAEMMARTIGYSIFQANELQGEDKFWDSSSAFAVQALILAHIDDCLKLDRKQTEKNKHIAIKKYIEQVKKNDNEQGKQLELIYKISRLQKEIKNITNVQIAEILGTDIQTVNDYSGVYIDEFEDVQYEICTDNEKCITLYSIVNTFTELMRVQISQKQTALDFYFSSRPVGDRAKLAYSGIEAAGSRTKGSIISVTLAQINIFVSNKIARMMSDNSVNLEDVGFGKKPIAIFLSIPGLDSSNSFIASMFIKQLNYILAQKATLSPTGKCQRQVVHILDEVCNIPKIDKLDTYVSLGLGLNLYYNIIIQEFAQLNKTYGDSAKTITSNCGNLIYILTNDDETAKKISTLIGNETITNISRTGSKLSLDKSLTENYDEKPLLNYSQLMHLHEGENVIKRVMTRKDLQGNDIESKPIFNRGETRFKYRYQYLQEYFPNPDSVDFYSLGCKSLSDVKLYAYDIKNYIEYDMPKKAISEFPLDKLIYSAEIYRQLTILKLISKQEKITIAKAEKLLQFAYSINLISVDVMNLFIKQTNNFSKLKPEPKPE